MRQPTDRFDAFKWWRDALAGHKPPIHPGDPQCGFFWRRMVRHGPKVPAAIWLEQEVDPDTGELIGDETLRCSVGEEAADPFKEWTYAAGNPITEEEYRFLIADAAWARDYAPESPQAQPRKKIDPLSVEPVFR
jgi:hypothetical protein